jgi:hypothetical protein
MAFALLISLCSLNDTSAQVNYSNNFNANSTGWTGTITRTTATSACGSASMRRNMYSGATTGTMISPLTGTSLGGLTTLTYNYKVADWSANTVGTANPWGSFNVQYGATATGPWTTFQTINSGNHIVSGTCSTVVVTFTPPAGALYIKWDAVWTAGDYYINFDDVSVTESLGGCTGTPVGGTTNSSTASACSGTSFTLSVTGDENPLLSGLTYQWQSADDAGFTVGVTNLGTAQTQITSQTAAKYYRRSITCTNSGLSSFSSVLSVGMNSLLNCYCASTHTSGCSGDAIVVATLNTLSNNTGATCPANPAYSYYFPGVSQTTLYKGSSYSLVLLFGTDANQYAGAWIDYDNNGTLDAGENIGLTGNAGSSGTATINFTVPPTATAALTRLRIIGGNDAAVTAGQACGASSSTWGETEDYDITIAVPPACSGTPATGTANASSAVVCPGGTSNLSLTGIGIETGYTYQWQESADDINYNNIGGATLATYTASPLATTYFRCLVTCSNSGLSAPSTSTLVTFDNTANAGTISGPSSGLTYTNLAYSTNAYTGNLQWQSATALAGPYSDIAAATLDNVTLVSNAGGTFYVRLRAASPTCTTYSNVITIVVSAAGDNVCSPVSITTGNNGPYTNIGATGEVGEVSPPETSCNSQSAWCAASNSVVNSIWFSFVAPPSGRVSIRLNPNYTLWDSQFALYSASNCANFGTFTLIAANDDSSSTPFNSYIAPKCLTPGATYYLKVDGYQASTNGSWGILLTEESSILPTATISGSQAICNGNSANLSIAFTGTSLFTYSVNGGAPVTTSNNPETVVVSPGTTTAYSVTAISDANCPAGTTSGTANVQVDNAPPANSLTITSMPSSGCVGNVVTVNTNAVINATTYTWSVPAGSLVNGVAGPVTTAVPTANITLGAVPANASGWEVCVFASNACGVTNTQCKYIRGVLSLPAPIAGSTNACPNTNGNYSTAAVTGAASYAWSITGDATVSGTGTSATVTFGPTFTSGTLCVRAELACGYQGPQRCLTITNGVGTLGLMTGSFAVCPGQSGLVYSIPPVTNASSYTWTVPANISIVSGQGTNSVTVNADPGFTLGNICVTATSPCGIVSAPRCKTISSTKPGTPGNITGAATGVCNSTVTHTVPSVAGITSYTWSAPAGASIISGQGTNSVDVSYSNSFTTGQLCVTANNACGSSTARCINVKGAPATPGIVTGPATACAGEQGLSFSISAVYGASSYSWTLPAGATIVAGANTTNIVVDWGNVSGSVLVSASNGCGASGVRTFSVLVNCRISGSELPGAVVSAYPNPVSAKLNVDLQASNTGTYTLELSDLSGRVVSTQVVNAIEGMNSNSIDVTGLSKGMYMLSVKNAEGFAQQIRIAVQ